jgi:hypothetical protein
MGDKDTIIYGLAVAQGLLLGQELPGGDMTQRLVALGLQVAQKALMAHDDAEAAEATLLAALEAYGAKLAKDKFGG